MTKLPIDVHFIDKPNNPFCRAFLNSIKQAPVYLYQVEHIPGNTAKAREKGFALGKEKYITYIDPDDLVALDIFTRLFEYMEDNPTLVGVCSDELIISEEGDIVSPGWSSHPEKFQTGWFAQYLPLFKVQGIYQHHINLIKREAYEACLPLQTKRVPEPVMMHQLATLGPLARLPQIGYYWRLNQNSTCLTYTPQELEEALGIIKKMEE